MPGIDPTPVYYLTNGLSRLWRAIFLFMDQHPANPDGIRNLIPELPACHWALIDRGGYVTALSIQATF
jgi:hypothetical protein